MIQPPVRRQADQDAVLQLIEKDRAATRAAYPGLWKRLLRRWCSGGQAGTPDDDAAWLMFSANYLLRTRPSPDAPAVRWAIDPITLPQRMGEPLDLESQAALRRDLAPLQFVVLTHNHGDHYCPALINALADLPVRWVIPFFMMARVQDETYLPPERIIIAEPDQPLTVEGIHLTPFESLHTAPGRERDPNRVRELGYLVRFNGKSLLFPGDIRCFDARLLPDLSADYVFAHLWLGYQAALDGWPDMLDSYCRFCLDLHPQHVVLTHLNEVGRPPNSLWTKAHARAVHLRLQSLAPKLHVSTPVWGQRICLH